MRSKIAKYKHCKENCLAEQNSRMKKHLKIVAKRILE